MAAVDPADAPNPAALVGLLAEDVRLRVVAALALGASKPDDLLTVTGLNGRDLGLALRRLEKGGLVSIVDGQVLLNAEVFKAAARAAAPEQPAEDFGSGDPRDEAVLRTFVRGGKLLQMPMQHGKRRVVLEHIAAVFEPGVRYAEREVNAILRAWFADYAMLRRYLVDGGFLDREAGEYWRIGGWVDDVAPPAPAAPVAAAPGPAAPVAAAPGPVAPAAAAPVAPVAAAPGPAASGPGRAVHITRVAAYALIRDAGRVLLTRITAGRRLGGIWNLPGGRVEFGESPEQALVREAYEETGLTVRPRSLRAVDSYIYSYDDGPEHVTTHSIAIVYDVEFDAGTPRVTEVDSTTDAVQWWPVSEAADETRVPTTALVRKLLAD